MGYIIAIFYFYSCRVNLPIAYYLSEGLYSSLDQLENVKAVPLYVFTVELKENSVESELCLIIQKLLTESSAWILDIDLDFFSTKNPFKSMFTEVHAQNNFGN